MSDEDKELTDQITEQLVELASDTLVNADSFYVQKLLDIIAEMENEPGISEAMVSDESCIGDFFTCWWNNESELMTQALAKLKAKIGVEVKFEDLLINVANKLKN